MGDVLILAQNTGPTSPGTGLLYILLLSTYNHMGRSLSNSYDNWRLIHFITANILTYFTSKIIAILTALPTSEILGPPTQLFI